MPATPRHTHPPRTPDPIPRPLTHRPAQREPAPGRLVLGGPAPREPVPGRPVLGGPAPRGPVPGRPVLGEPVQRGPVQGWLLPRALVAAVVLLGATACTGLNEASAAGVADDDLVSEAADRLAAADRESWTATYRLAGGDTARVSRSQDPDRLAYEFPSGRVIHTPAARIRCTPETSPPRADTTVVCTATRPVAPDSDDVPASTGMITPGAVLDLLEAAAIDPQVAVGSRETTIAGRYASCLRLGGVGQSSAADFDVCVTVDGTVAAFTGTVSGAPVEMVLTEYHPGTDEADFVMPPTARFVDRRPN